MAVGGGLRSLATRAGRHNSERTKLKQIFVLSAHGAAARKESASDVSMDKGTPSSARVRIRDRLERIWKGSLAQDHHSTELVATSKVTVQIDHHHEHNDASATRTVDVDLCTWPLFHHL